MNSGLHLAQVVVLTSGAGLLMVAGSAKGRLRWKPPRRRRRR
jgi:hypothetical protein